MLGRGEQMTLLAMELLADCRGALLPDPKQVRAGRGAACMRACVVVAVAADCYSECCFYVAAKAWG